MSLISDILNDMTAEAGRLGTQGANELAAALFSNSNAYVQYGAGQNPVEVERAPEQAPAVEQPSVEVQQPEITPNRGMEM